MTTKRYTAADMLGELVKADSRHEALDRNDECSECGVRLYGQGRPIILADTGHYCSERCAISHGAFCADVMNQRRRDDGE